MGAIVLLLVIDFSVQTSVKSKTKVKSRSKSRSRMRSMNKSHRRQSMMEYVNNFMNDAKSHSKRKMRFAEKKKREEEEEEEEEESTALAKKNENNPLAKSELYKIHKKNDEPTPVLEYFFMVSSTAFLNRNLFPPVHIEKRKFWTIKTDTNNFRINDSWKKDEKHDKKEQPNDKFFYFRLSGLN